MNLRHRVLTAALVLLPAAAAGQSSPSLTSTMPPSVLRLSLADAVARGLQHNVAAIVGSEERRIAEAERQHALGALLPHVSADVRQSVQVINTAAFGFGGFGDLPNLVGPFTVFDARLRVSAPIVDAEAMATWRSRRAEAGATDADYRSVREAVVLAVGSLYLQALADTARAASLDAQVATAEALAHLATDQNAAGVVARIDVLRQQVQLEAVRAEAIAAHNQLAKRKLRLARAIGVPPGETLELTDPATFTPAPAVQLDAAIDEALTHRDDVQAARARVDAARAARQAAVASGLPSLHVDTDIGAIGLTANSAERTYTAAASLHVPLFEGGRRRARTTQADAELRQREAQLADLETGVRFEVAEALLDVDAAAAAADVARRGEQLAREELTQAEDRFRAGVANTIELTQAQDALARASEQTIASIYAHNLAKAQFVRAIGEGEARFLPLVGGRQ